MIAVDAYRDDGPAALMLGRSVGRAVPASALAMTAVAAIPVVIALGSRQADPLGPAVGAATIWFIVVAGAACAHSEQGRLGWLVPPMLRAAEYGFLLRITALTHPRALPVCFALLAALAFHHYDLVYQLRTRQSTAPRWVQRIGAGWDGRMGIAYAALTLGSSAYSAVLAAGAVLLGLVYAAESATAWRRFEGALQHQEPDNDEDTL